MSATPRVGGAVRQLSSRCLPRPSTSSTIRAVYHCPFSTSRASHQGETEAYRPRWQQTPAALRAPVRLRGPLSNQSFKANEDPKVLDAFYQRFLGEYAEYGLSEEVRWLAVTHKSFEQGGRGYNAKLAYMGKRIAELQTSLALLRPRHAMNAPGPDKYGRTPFAHPALDQLNNLKATRKQELLHPSRLGQFAEFTYGLDKVMRWTPRLPDDLKASGSHAVFGQSVFAIIGAIALEHGGAAANEVFNNRVLKHLGV